MSTTLQRLKKLRYRVHRTQFLLRFLPFWIVDWCTNIPTRRICYEAECLHPKAAIVTRAFKQLGYKDYVYPLNDEYIRSYALTPFEAWQVFWLDNPARRTLLDELITYLESEAQ